MDSQSKLLSMKDSNTVFIFIDEYVNYVQLEELKRV